ncbi:MAG: hypothetical protein H7Z43_02050 [Clostridia bacterium]|nr:hypothetical protein [Deltaproteobacteria bacterium]
MGTLIRKSNTPSFPTQRSLAVATPQMRPAPATTRIILKRSVTTQKLRMVAARNSGVGKGMATFASAALAPAPTLQPPALSKFAREHGLSNQVLGQLMANARGDAFEAVKVYAVIADAMNGKLTPNRACAMGTVLEALRDGRLIVQTADIAGSYAQYNHQINTLLCPRRSFAKDSLATRATIIHEAQHAIQDGRYAVEDRYTSEAEGHEAAADYLLHSAGALVETSRGTKVDVTRAQELIAEQTEQCDAAAARALVGRIVRENIAAGSTDLNGQDLGDSAEEQSSAIALVFPTENFHDVYARAVRTTGNEHNVEALGYVMHKMGI